MRLDAVMIYPGDDPVSVVSEAGNRRIPIRVAGAFDQFAQALGKHTAAEVQVSDALELPLTTDGVLFVCRQDVLDRSMVRQANRIHRLASRTVVVDVVRGYELELCERLALAAAVGSDQYFHWKSCNNIRRPAELMGLKSVGSALGATWSMVPALDGPSYSLLRHPHLHELPAFLAAYLEAYAPLL
jgi:hypothetical protein